MLFKAFALEDHTRYTPMRIASFPVLFFSRTQSNYINAIMSVTTSQQLLPAERERREQMSANLDGKTLADARTNRGER